MKLTHTEDYRALRAREYPPQSDYLDAVYWQERGDPSKMEAYLAAIDAVKARYPKPQN
jgi:hypothetical protein